MENQLQVFLSNRVESLFDNFKEKLFSSETTPFTRRLVVVPSPAMKNWLMMRMADDPDLQIAAGLQVVYLESAISWVIDTLATNKEDFPRGVSSLELALRIEVEIRKIASSYSSMTGDDQQLWGPLIEYLQCHVSRKSERRLIALSDEVAFLFMQYGKFGTEMLRAWREQPSGHWQEELWKRTGGEVFPRDFHWETSDVVVHFFLL